MKESFYFSHDQNARNDIKAKAMIKRYGMAGYGRYWVLIEMLREQDGHLLPFEDFTFIALSVEFNTDEEEARKFVTDLVDTFQLLSCDDSGFWSESLLRRMDKRDEIRQKRSEAGRKSAAKRAAKKKTTLTSVQQNSTSVEQKGTSVEQVKESKVKESKVKEKEKNTKKKEGVNVNDDALLKAKIAERAGRDDFGSSIVDIGGIETERGNLSYDDLVSKMNKYNKKTEGLHVWLGMNQEQQQAAFDALDGFCASYPEIKWRPNPFSYLNDKLYLMDYSEFKAMSETTPEQIAEIYKETSKRFVDIEHYFDIVANKIKEGVFTVQSFKEDYPKIIKLGSSWKNFEYLIKNYQLGLSKI